MPKYNTQVRPDSEAPWEDAEGLTFEIPGIPSHLCWRDSDGSSVAISFPEGAPSFIGYRQDTGVAHVFYRGTKVEEGEDGFPGAQGHEIELESGTQMFFTLTSRTGSRQNLQIRDPDERVIVDTAILSTDGKHVSTGVMTASKGGVYRVRFPRSQLVKFKVVHIANQGEVIASSASYAPSEDTRQYGDTIANLVWF